MKIDPNAPAYPMPDANVNTVDDHGMTIRTQIAAMAMQGLLHDWINGAAQVRAEMDAEMAEIAPDLQVHAWAARSAIRFTDALIAELNKDQPDAH